jgi:hypothetical protein
LNSTLGKSYSIVGYGANKGIVPLVCEQIFKEIDAKQKANPEFQIEVDRFYSIQFNGTFLMLYGLEQTTKGYIFDD